MFEMRSVATSTGFASRSTMSARLPGEIAAANFLLVLRESRVPRIHPDRLGRGQALLSLEPVAVTQQWIALSTSVDSTGASEEPASRTPASSMERNG